MLTKVVVCHNEECRDSLEVAGAAARPMAMVEELVSAWTFQCLTCGARRAVTKDQVGGSFGVGRRDDGTGPRGGKGPSKWRGGVGG